MAILKLTQEDIAPRKIKLSKDQVTFDSARANGWEYAQKNSSNIINQYIQKMNNGEYLSSDDLASYKTAVDDYVKNSENLRRLSRLQGKKYTSYEEQEWNDNISSLKSGYDQVNKEYSRFKTEDEFNDNKKLIELRSMSTDEIKPYLQNDKEKEKKKKQLEKEQEKIKEQIAELGASGNKGINAQKKKKLWDQYHSIRKEIETLDNGGIAYTTLSGDKITWQDLYEQKLAEEREDGIREDADFMERAAGAHHLEEDDKDWEKFYLSHPKVSLFNKREKYVLKYYVEKARKERGANEDESWKIENVDPEKYYAEKAKREDDVSWDEDWKIDYTEAEKYYDCLVQIYEREQADDIVEWAQASNFRALIVSAFSGIESAFTGFENYFSNDDYIPYTALSYASSELRESLATDGFQMPEWLGGGSSAQMVFDLVGTSARMVPSQIIGAVPGVGQVAGPVFMGMSSAGSAYQDAVNSGLSKKEAWLYSRLVGGSEAGLTYLFGGFSKLGGKVTNDVLKKALSGVSNGFARFALTTGGKVISEGFEEGAQSLLEPLFKNVATGFEADAYKDFEWSQVFYDALLGGLSAAPSASVDGVGAAANSSAAKINNAKIGIKLTNSGNVDTIINAALSLPADSEAYKLASKLGNKTPTSAQLGKLYVALSQYVEGKINDTAVSAITQRLTELGVSNPQQYASIIADLKSHKNVGTLKTKKVMNNPQAFQVFGELSSFGAQSKIFRDESSTNAQTKTVEWIEQLESDVEKLNVAQLIVLGLQNNAAGTNAVNIITSLLGGSENNQTANTETPTSDSERNLNAALSAVTGEKTPLQQGENGDIINSRGEENGSNNPELLEGRKVSTTGRGKNRVRTHGANTEIIRRELADVLQSKGNDVVALAAGESAWLSERNLQSASQVGGGLEENFLRSLQRVKSNGYDSIGRVLDADLQEKVSDTVFKYEDGTVFSFFHWTPNEFETFKYGDGAFHCGTLMSALAVKNRSEPSGILKEMYVISKNPFVLRDEGAFGPYSVALQLKEFGIINDKELAKISELKGFWSNRYETEACEYVRELLKSLGYDSYFYQNIHEDTGSWSVGVFDADQIITIAENGVLKPNCGVSEATSNNEAAFSMLENDAEGDYSAEGDTDPTQTSQEPQGGNTETESGIGETISDRVSILKNNADRRHTTLKEQQYIKSICDALGREVVFENVFEELRKQGVEVDNNNIPDGYIDENGVIHIGFTVYNPVQFILKHELTHFGEGTEAYITFIEAVQSSKTYLKWLQKKTGSDSNSKGKLEALYREAVMQSRKKTAPIGAAKAQYEMYADFCGDVMFSERGLASLAKAVNAKHKPKAIQFVLDFITYLKQKLSGNKQVTFELTKLESKYADMLRAANETTSPNNIGEVKYSLVAPFTDNNGNQFNNAVLLDTDFFDGLSPRNWGNKLKEYVYNRSKNNPIIMPIVDENGNVQELRFADLSDRVTKNNASNHKVIDKLSSSSDNISKLAVLHIDEIVEVSEENNPYYTNEHNHQWLDKNGWLHRNTNVINQKNGNIYNLTFDIAKTEDGRTILYATDGKIKKVGNVQVNSLNVRGSGLNSNFNNSIPDNNSTVKKNSVQENKKYSIPTDAAALLERYDSGEIDREEYIEQLDELWGKANERYGAIEQGENAKVDISVPKKVNDNKNTERFVRTFIEKGELTPEMIENVEQEVLLGDIYSYTVESDEKAMEKAQRYISNGTAETEWKVAINDRAITKADIAIGETLLLQAIKNNDCLRVLELSSELADAFTRAGQVVQAARMFKKMSGIGMLTTAQRNIKTLNKDLEIKYGEGKVTVKLDPLLAEQLAKAESLDDIEIVYKNVLQDVAAQVPSTFLDKLNAWRYFAMLASPRTHIRNLVSNTVFMPSKMLKDVIATGLEHLLIRDQNKRTKAIRISQKYKDFAAKDIKSREAKLALEGKGMLDEKGMIQEFKRTFETEWLEKMTKGNSNLLEKEDMWFKSIHYKQALAGFLQARKVDLKNIDESTLNAARDYASKEARKATFQDASALADLLNNIRTPKKWKGNKAAETSVLLARGSVEGTLPFKRTPINIVKRGVEYSPLGLTKELTIGLWDVTKGNITVSEYCDGLAAGITGTGLTAIGWFLASAGLVVGGFGNDDEDKFRELNGEQEYSIQIFGKSYSIEWAAPACIPFFIGVELSEEMSKDGIQLKDIPDVLWNTLEPITNLSMLSGVRGLIDAVKYEDGSKTIGTMAGETIESFVMQLVPSIFGSISRTIDDKQRLWYNDKNSKYLDTFSQSTLNNFKSKIPGLSYTQAPKIDAWGREVSRGSVGERALENFISPGYYSEIEYSKTDKELQRLFEETGEKVFPKEAEKSFTVNGETKYLTQDEYVTYAKAKGQYSHDYITEFMSNSCYDKLSDEQRTEIIAKLYEYATAKAKITVSDYDLTKRYKTVTRLESDGISAVMYYIYNTITSDNYADTNGDNKVSKLEKRTAREAVGFDVEIARKIK